MSTGLRMFLAMLCAVVYVTADAPLLRLQNQTYAQVTSNDDDDDDDDCEDDDDDDCDDDDGGIVYPSPGANRFQRSPVDSVQQSDDDDDNARSDRSSRRDGRSSRRSQNGLPGVTPDDERGRAIGRVTPRDVQIIRFAELYTDTPERARVSIKEGTLDAFFKAVAGRGDYDTNEQQHAFRNLRTDEQVQIIKKLTGSQFQDDITIASDPERLRTFRSRIWPMVRRGCASNSCHGNPDNPFYLNSDGRQDMGALYYNFYRMDSYVNSQGKRLFDRGQPANSLLLDYGQRPTDAEGFQRHPQVDLDRPLWTGPASRSYQVVLEWMRDLSPIQPMYRISITPASQATTQPGAQSSTPPSDQNAGPQGVPALPPAPNVSPVPNTTDGPPKLPPAPTRN